MFVFVKCIQLTQNPKGTSKHFICMYFDLRTPFWGTFIKLETKKECKQKELRLGVTFMHFAKLELNLVEKFFNI